MKTALIALAVLLVPALVQAKEHPIDKGGVVVTVPDSWKMSHVGKSYNARPKDGKVFIMLLVLPTTLERAGKTFERMLKDGTVTKPLRKTKINGMSAILMEGTRELRGKSMVASFMALETPNGKLLQCYAMGRRGDDWDLHAEAVAEIYRSVAPDNGSAPLPVIPSL